MPENAIRKRQWLYPLTWLYGLGVYLRNKFFDWGWLRSKDFDLPVICIGNIAVGGTGKTPHTEYVIKLLSDAGLNVATLSRGYKRKRKGYILADENSDARQIGDEPCQMKRKFPAIAVAVDEDRTHGIERLLQLKEPRIDAILLDDAFQHRHVKAGLNILLTDYHRLWCDDALLPAGNLREPAQAKNRAQIVIVTKCPKDIKPIDFNIIGKRLQLYPYQRLYFSSLRYGRPVALFPRPDNTPGLSDDVAALLVTGIASPEPMLQEVQAHIRTARLLAFPDHHDFSKKDFLEIERKFDLLEGPNKCILTTEKDAARLRNSPLLPERLKPYIYIIPIEIYFLQGQQQTFNHNIINYVRTNPRNC